MFLSIQRLVFIVIGSLFVLMIQSNSIYAAEKPIARKIIGLFNSKDDQSIRHAPIHRHLEMPLNYLGFDMQIYDIKTGVLPALTEDVRAIAVWFRGSEIKHSEAYIDWLEDALDQGIKLIIIENLGISEEYRSKPENITRLNKILSRIGIRDIDYWNSLTYDVKITYKDPKMIGFERELPTHLTPYMTMQVVPGIGVSHLKVSSESAEQSADLVVTSPQGGYVAAGYAFFEGEQLVGTDAELLNIDIKEENEDQKDEEDKPTFVQQWYINPFLFLRNILGDIDEPKPDVTTHYGKRIYYSHIDGDGWNNLTEIKPYRQHQVISAEVIMNEILAAYPDMPVSVSAIVAELDTACYGLSVSSRVAKDIFALPNIEPSSHTHSHPLHWEFFKEATPEKEIAFLKLYPDRPGGNSILNFLEKQSAGEAWQNYLKDSTNQKFTYDVKEIYETPRSYACEPFDLEQEISGSIDYIQALAPADKKLKLLQWSGDTSPYEEVLHLTREAGVLNINGGDSRFDNEYPSYATVSPIGIRVGNEIQIYSSNSNENTYTDLWTDRFYGFIFLKQTVENTGKPYRVMPFNIYYHMYSGQKLASLNAVKANVDYARKLDVFRMFASDFVHIANGFYTTEIIKVGSKSWKVKNRKKLNTLRFDAATLKEVDMDRSKGVLGQQYSQGSLYVTLDPDVDEPLIRLKEKSLYQRYPISKKPYLIESNWSIKDLHFIKKSLIMTARGFGDGDIVIKFPEPGSYQLTVYKDDREIINDMLVTDDEGVLQVPVYTEALEPVKVTLALVEDDNNKKQTGS